MFEAKPLLNQGHLGRRGKEGGNHQIIVYETAKQMQGERKTIARITRREARIYGKKDEREYDSTRFYEEGW